MNTTPQGVGDVAGVLERAADLIEPEGRWTQECYARDALRYPVNATSPSAVCWCVLGAIKRAGGFQSDIEAGVVIKALKEAFARKPRSMHEWNDAESRRQKQVVAKLREAATAARQASSC